MDFDFGEPCRRKMMGNKEENDIREIFYTHWEKMKNETKAVIDEISQWRSRTVHEINKYAHVQIRQLQLHYKHQLDIFDKERDENIALAKDFHLQKSSSQSKADDPFNDLCNRCRLLKFQVAQLEYLQDQNRSPKVVTVEDQKRGNKQNQGNTHGSNNSRTSLQSPSNGTSGSFMRNSSPNASNQSTSNSNNSKGDITDVHDLNNKCPICFMIFPLYMSADDRHQHVDEHMPDHENGTTTVL